MKTLYLECYSGISGDMTVAALLDLGADKNVLLEGIKSLNISGYDIKISHVKKCGIEACDFDVILHEDTRERHEEHEHSHSHDHGHAHNATCTHDHEHGHVHEHDHEHNHDHSHGHTHEHRNINDIFAVIDAAGITAKAKVIAKKIFGIVAEAESAVHGLPVEEVHFHEVGAVDSIVDIIGAAICIDNLGIERVVCTPLREGQGTVRCQHGRVPVPAPATLKIIGAYDIPLVVTQNQGEMVTPTGAAIVAALAESFAPAEIFSPTHGMLVRKTGYGAGKKDFAVANVLRASIVECVSGGAGCANKNNRDHSDEVLELNCNIDDMTGEQLAYACEVFMRNGARDCWLTPIIMKKGRPAHMLSLIVDPKYAEEFTRLIFLHTSTVGVRSTHHKRSVMSRRNIQVETGFGVLDVKECSYGDICKTYIEYESAKSLAESHNIPIMNVYRAGENTPK